MKKFKLVLKAVAAVAIILLLRHFDGMVFDLPEFMGSMLDIAYPFIYVLAVFAFVKFVDIVFAVISIEDIAKEQSEE